MINVKYSTFATAILWENINNDTLTLWVKCYNGVAAPPKLIRLKCANHNQNDNQG